MSLSKIYKAIVHEPKLVPECSYCAAMRWAVISALVTSLVLGIAVKSVVACLIGGFICSCTFVAFLYGVYKLEEAEEEEEEEKGWGPELEDLPFPLFEMTMNKGWKNLTAALESYEELQKAFTIKCMENAELKKEQSE